jgi:hypothetical protein
MGKLSCELKNYKHEDCKVVGKVEKSYQQNFVYQLTTGVLIVCILQSY